MRAFIISVTVVLAVLTYKPTYAADGGNKALGIFIGAGTAMPGTMGGGFALNMGSMARLKFEAVGAPFDPGFLIFSPLPAAIRLRLAWMFA